MTEPLAARLHFVVRRLRGVHAFLIGALRGYFSRAPGWVLLTTRGRKTGLPREVLLPCTRFDGTILVMSTYGERSDWMRNLRREPRVQVTQRGRVVGARAEVVEDLARKRALVTAHPFVPAAPFALVHVVALTILRPLVILQLRRWVRPRPVVLLHVDASR
jgi:deazaflavin-dependent oxidoreductase (nitroreductase family)